MVEVKGVCDMCGEEGNVICLESTHNDGKGEYKLGLAVCKDCVGYCEKRVIGVMDAQSSTDKLIQQIKSKGAESIREDYKKEVEKEIEKGG